MPPDIVITDQDMRDRLATFARGVKEATHHKAQWDADKVYWDSKAQEKIDASKEVPESIQKQQRHADRNVEHATEALARATVEHDELEEALTDAEVIKAT